MEVTKPHQATLRGLTGSSMRMVSVDLAILPRLDTNAFLPLASDSPELLAIFDAASVPIRVNGECQRHGAISVFQEDGSRPVRAFKDRGIVSIRKAKSYLANGPRRMKDLSRVF